MQSETELTSTFKSDIEEIVKGFIDDYGLKYDEEVSNLSEPLLRWLDFVSRYIPSVPRQVFFSKKFPKTLTPDVEIAFKYLKHMIETGVDINPYQSKGLILDNDTSEEKRQKRTDLLWADWGIHHLHLTSTPIRAGEYFSARSNLLLFCVIGGDFACLIDIRDHGKSNLFSDQELIKAVADTWPEIMERYRLKGVLAPETHLNSSEVATLRKGGVSSFVTIGNQVYMGPGMGITAASTSSRVSMAIVRIRKYVIELAKIVADPTSQFKTESAASGIEYPDYCIALTPRGLAVYEKHESKAFLLPRLTNPGIRSFVAELHDLVAPEWAVKYVVAKSGQA